MAPKANALGDFLRARRQQVRPADVGLVPGARRRVPGLRREELAMLAGISAEYYLRLEVGRDKNPSAQVLDALARALRLDIKATEHLHQLANSTVSRWDHTELDVVVEGLDRLIDELPFGNRFQSIPGRPGGKPDGASVVAGFRTGTKLPVLAPSGPRRPRALC
jgi:transcriptional regulator with XRE-family HTH domain